MLLFCLLLIITEKTSGLPNQDGLSNELRFIHQEIHLLRDENQNQNKEIALLKEIIIKSNDEQSQRSADFGKDSLSGSAKKRPARLLPLQLLFNRNFTDIPDDQLVSRRFFGPPHNCSELSKLGYTLNGFYHVKPTISNSSSNDDSTPLETVYCSFKQPGGAFDESKMEKRIVSKKSEGVPTSYKDLQEHLPNKKSNPEIADSIKATRIFQGPPHNCSDLSKMGHTLSGGFDGGFDESNARKRIAPKKEKRMPTNCKDLQLVGHRLNGIYFVKTPNQKRGTKIEAVYCNFQSETTLGDFQEFVGIVDVKTRIVHFYVQRDHSFSTPNAVITFNKARLNEGKAMDLRTGKFTAPVPGIYHFQFAARKVTKPDAPIFLQVNGDNFGIANTNHNGGGWATLSFSVSLRLKVNDQINLYQQGAGELYDDGSHFTHFSGWLAEEDLVK